MEKLKFKLYICLILLPITCISQKYATGILNGIDEGYKTTPQKASLTRSFYDKVPSEYSLKHLSPTPSDQGDFGTCTGWATAYAARTIIEAQKQNWNDKNIITQNAFSPIFQYRQSDRSRFSSNCDGARTSKIVESLKIVGSVPKNNFYFNYGPDLCPSSMPLDYSNYSKAKNYKIKDFASLWPYNYKNENGKIKNVKTSISQGNPVVISMICPESFHRVNNSGVWQPTQLSYNYLNTKEPDAHAICVVGYDDNKFGGAFEIQNSWGTNWGNQGYAWIKYKDFAYFVYQAYEIINQYPPAPKKPYLAGSLRLFDLDDNQNLAVEKIEEHRNWNVVNPNNKIQKYKVTPNLLSGSEMRIYIKSDEPSYLYMLGTGKKDKNITTLFPPQGISPALNYKSHEIAIPSEDYFFKMDNTIGENYIIVFFSKNKLDIDSIKRQIAHSSIDNISERIQNTIDTRLINSEHINYEENNIEFNVNPNNNIKNNGILAMIIEFNQVN